ncbi:MAG TPA: hypothetical protein VH306_10445 [Gaiellaceae bacterium]|jgi:protein-S-isoprenylcysteine O-methyltransferase Ste14
MAAGGERDPVGAGGTTAPRGGLRRHARIAESVFSRSVMTLGIIGVGTAIAAILGSQDVDSWIVGLVVSLVTVILAAILWTRRRL